MKTKSRVFTVGAAVVGVAAVIGMAKSSHAGGAACLAASCREEPVLLQTRVDRPVLIKHGGEQEVTVKIDLTAMPHVKGKRSPLNIAVVLDRSGSMAGRKLEQAKQAAAMLVDQLAPGDIFSLVSYESEVEVLVPATRADEKKRLHRAIERITSGGSTALYAGVKTGAEELEEYLSERRINRVLLLSDGLANVGPSSNREIANLGRRISRNGIAVTTIGLGHDYNEDLMAALAEASDANYYYVQDVEKLGEVFAQELGELQSVVARRIIVRITLPEGVEPMGFLGRPERFEGRRGEVIFNQLSGSQNRYVLMKCRIDPEKVKDLEQVAEVELEYRNELTEDGAKMLQKSRVGIEVTEDVKLAAKSRDADVEVEAKIVENAMETEKAIAMADAGKLEEARRSVECQIDALCDLRVSVPAAQRGAIDEEIELLERNRDEFKASGLSKEGRKVLQWNAYQLKNAKKGLRTSAR